MIGVNECRCVGVVAIGLKQLLHTYKVLAMCSHGLVYGYITQSGHSPVS